MGSGDKIDRMCCVVNVSCTATLAQPEIESNFILWLLVTQLSVERSA